MPDYREGVKKEVAEIKFLIHDLRVEGFFNEILHYHVTLNTDLEIYNIEQAQVLHAADVQELKSKLGAARRAFQDYSNAVKSFSPDRTVLLLGRRYVDAIHETCHLILSPLWGRSDQVLSFLPKEARSVRSRRHYRNCISWLYGVHLRIAAFREESNDAGVKEEFDIAEDIRDFTQDVVRGYVVEKSEARVELQLHASLGLLDYIPADDILREIADVLGDIELLLDARVIRLLAKGRNAQVHAVKPADAIAVVAPRAHGARLFGQEGKHLIRSPPQRAENEMAGFMDGVDVASAKEQDRSVRRETLHRVRIVLERSARSAELGLQLLNIRCVQNLRLLDVVDLEVSVQGDVVMKDLVEKALDTKVVNEELDLGNILLDPFPVVGHRLGGIICSTRRHRSAPITYIKEPADYTGYRQGDPGPRIHRAARLPPWRLLAVA